MNPTTAWEWICWFALGFGLLSMWRGRVWIDRATEHVVEANRVYAEAIREKRETLQLLDDYLLATPPEGSDNE